MSHTYVLSWDINGLESCINITDIDKEQMWEALKSTGDNSNKGRSHTVSSIVSFLMLRARYNSQRHYEIYAIDTDDSITASDLKKMFNENPQGSADLIRERGRQLYSDRVDHKSVKIT